MTKLHFLYLFFQIVFRILGKKTWKTRKDMKKTRKNLKKKSEKNEKKQGGWEGKAGAILPRIPRIYVEGRAA